MYGDGLIPRAVLDEIEAKPASEVQVIRNWLQAYEVEVRPAADPWLEQLPSELGVGEREALALALECPLRVLILDDQEGRRIAREKQLPVTGACLLKLATVA